MPLPDPAARPAMVEELSRCRGESHDSGRLTRIEELGIQRHDVVDSSGRVYQTRGILTFAIRHLRTSDTKYTVYRQIPKVKAHVKTRHHHSLTPPPHANGRWSVLISSASRLLLCSSRSTANLRKVSILLVLDGEAWGRRQH